MKTSSFLTLGAVVLLAPGVALADLVTVDQVIYQSGPGQDVSGMTGTLDISVSGNTLTILMRNTSTDAAFTDATKPASMLLTGFGLQLPGVNILSGTVEVNGGSTALNFPAGQSTTDIANQYLYANKVIDGYGMAGVLTVDSIVSSVQNGQGTRFAGGPPPTINGPDFGALSANETQFGSSQAAVRDTVKFVLTLDGAAPDVATIDAGNVVLAFGSPTAVPDGGSTLALLGLALSGLGWMVRRKSNA